MAAVAGTKGKLTTALFVVLALFAFSVPAGAAGKPAKQPRPNVVVIVTDDQSLEQYRPDVMPITSELLGENGTTFSQAVVSTPQCCPSRAAFYTGQYGHNNGVIANNPGYPLLETPANTLPAWLGRAGYRTIHIGKFLNGYAEVKGLAAAPGWDRWITLLATDYQNPTFSLDGKPYQPDSYLTDELNRQTVDAIDTYAPKRKPFYLHLDQFAPHVGSGLETGRCQGGAIPSPVDDGLFTDVHAPVNPATQEADVTDKPHFISRRLPLGTAARERIDTRYGCALAAMQDVDRGVHQIIDALRRNGELDNTMIAFVSDNGLAYGEHRVGLDKGLSYEEHVRVPMVIRPPASFPARFRRGATVDAPVANIDFAPTILKLAGADPCVRRKKCRRLDGRSLVPLLKGRSPKWTKSRAINLAFDINRKEHGLSCTWSGYRTPDEMVTLHSSLPNPVDNQTCEPAHEAEAYDLDRDPYELDNAGTLTGAQAKRLGRLDRCSGIKGRDKKLKRVPFCE